MLHFDRRKLAETYLRRAFDTLPAHEQSIAVQQQISLLEQIIVQLQRNARPG